MKNSRFDADSIKKHALLDCNQTNHTTISEQMFNKFHRILEYSAKHFSKFFTKWASRCQPLEASRCQPPQASRYQPLNASRCQLLKASRCQSLEASRCQPLEASRFQPLEASRC